MKLTEKQKEQILSQFEDIYEDGKIKMWNSLVQETDNDEERIFDNNESSWREQWNGSVFDALKLLENSDISMDDELIIFDPDCRTGNMFSDFCDDDALIEKIECLDDPKEFLDKFHITYDVDVIDVIDDVVHLLLQIQDVQNVSVATIKANVESCLEKLSNLKDDIAERQ